MVAAPTQKRKRKKEGIQCMIQGFQLHEDSGIQQNYAAYQILTH